MFFYLFADYNFIIQKLIIIFLGVGILGYSSHGTGEAEKTDDQSKINNISAFENDNIPNFSAIADFCPDSAKSSPFGIILP